MRQVFANLLIAPILVLVLVLLYLSWKVDADYAPWMIPPVIVIALIYIFSPQINWWWYNKRPPELESGLQRMLERFCPFYQQLDDAGRKKFRERVALFRMGTDWMAVGWPEDMEQVPPDVQLALSAQAVLLGFHQDDLLFHRFEKVIVYPQPFPSPDHLYAHASELHAGDGCLLFSAEQVMLGFTQPAQWYNVGLHEYARVFHLTHPDAPWPELPEDDALWEKLRLVSGMPRKHVDAVIGIEDTEALPMAIHHYFTFPDRFRVALPEVAAAFDGIFGEKKENAA